MAAVVVVVAAATSSAADENRFYRERNPPALAIDTCSLSATQFAEWAARTERQGEREEEEEGGGEKEKRINVERKEEMLLLLIPLLVLRFSSCRLLRLFFPFLFFHINVYIYVIDRWIDLYIP